MTDTIGASWTTTNLAKSIEDIDRKQLVAEYEARKRNAPRRPNQEKPFFVGHDGRLSGNRRSGIFSENHLAIAIWRLKHLWPRPAGGSLFYLDYQFPLREKQEDKERAVDLFGITESGRLVVSELKVQPTGGGRPSEGPMDALMRALGYAAIIEANIRKIGREVIDLFGARSVSEEPPIVQILAPKDWWRSWFELKDSTRRKSGPWEVRFGELINDIGERLGIEVECVAMTNVLRTVATELPVEPRLRMEPTTFEVRSSGASKADGNQRVFTKLPSP